MNELTEVLASLKAKEQTGSDYTAMVTKVEGQTAYVQITGSDIADTPVSMSISVKPGDMVRVRVANGKAWITGNDTSPPTDDSQLDEVVELLNKWFAKITFHENGNATFGGSIETNGGKNTGEFVFSESEGSRKVHMHKPPRLYEEDGEVYGEDFGSIFIEQNDDEKTETLIDPGLIDCRKTNHSVTTSYEDIYIVDQSTGEACQYDATGAHQFSDRKLKTDIEKIRHDLAKKMQPVQFRFKAGETIHYGFNAQEVMEVFPGAVKENKNGFLSLNYTELIAPLYALVLDQEKRITSLETRLKELEDKLT
jgi:hypothetical protein